MSVSLETFQTAVRRLADLRQEGLARLVISPDGFVSVGIDQSAEDKPEPGGGLFAEIFEVLSSIAHGMSVDDWVKRTRQEEAEDEETDVDEDSVLRGKYKAAEEAFSPAELIRRTQLRETSTLPVWMSISWEVVIRAAHSRRRTPSDSQSPFAQIRLSAQGRPRTFFDTEQTDSMTFGLDLDDLTDMLRELQRLKDELERKQTSFGQLSQVTSAAGHDDAQS